MPKGMEMLLFCPPRGVHCQLGGPQPTWSGGGQCGAECLRVWLQTSRKSQKAGMESRPFCSGLLKDSNAMLFKNKVTANKQLYQSTNSSGGIS